MQNKENLESRYHLLFETAGDAILLMDGDRFVDSNQSALRMFGCTREQLLGARPYDFSPPAQPDGQLSEENGLHRINQAMSGAPQTFEWVHRRRDGTLFDAEVTLNSFELDGKPLLVAIVRDVTERKRLEYAILAEHQKANDEMSRLLAFEMLLTDISASLLGASAQELEIEIPSALRRICEFLGIDSSAIMEPTLAAAPGIELIYIYRNVEAPPPPERLVAKEIFPWCERQVQAGEKIVIDAVRLLPPEASIDKSSFQYYGVQSSLIFPLVDRGASILGTLSFGRVKEERPWDEAMVKRLQLAARIFSYTLSRRRAEVSLQNSEARFRALSEALPVGVYMLQDSKLAYVNPALAKMYGYERAELIGSDPLILTAPEDRNEAGEELIKRLSGEISENRYEFSGRKKDGEARYFELFSTAAVLNDRPATIGNLLDITEQKRADDKLQTAYADLKLTLEDTVQTIAKIVEMRDPYTAGHQQRVASLAVAIGEELHLAPDVLEQLRIAGTMHDIGKIRIPVEILNRPGKLNKQELELLKTHPDYGYDIVSNISFLSDVAQIIRQHHERFDGSGYPDGLKGEQIRLEARIIAVADVTEAMASHRPYRPALGIDVALAEVSKNSGTFFDPTVVAACMELFHKKGFSLASLNSKEESRPSGKPPINLRATP